jgi:hypothetical protein
MAFSLCVLKIDGTHAQQQSSETIRSVEVAAGDEGIRQLRQLSPESYVDIAAIWNSERWPIPVCWEHHTKPYGVEKRWVELATADVIERVSSLRFEGSIDNSARWSQCEIGSMGIRISISDVQPQSHVGRQWRNTHDGTPIEVPTDMTLNFDLGGPWSVFCSDRKELCVKVIAVHEFLHAVGFLHEHLRDDAPEGCKERFRHMDDVRGIKPRQISLEYDGDSMMDYCNSIYRQPIALSQNDVEAIEHFYRLQ